MGGVEMIDLEGSKHGIHSNWSGRTELVPRKTAGASITWPILTSLFGQSDSPGGGVTLLTWALEPVVVVVVRTLTLVTLEQTECLLTYDGG